MMRKSWTKWILIAVIALALIVGVPIIINECYKTNSGYMTIWGCCGCAVLLWDDLRIAGGGGNCSCDNSFYL